MNFFSNLNLLPKVTNRINRGLNKYGDGLLFRAITKTPPIIVNPAAATGIHTAVPHRYIYAYLVAIKSFLRYHADVAVYVHDDGSLREDDKKLIRRHVSGATIVDRAWADQNFKEQVGDDFLIKVRKSYTSYLKLFDPTLVSTHQRILIVDTDVLFLNQPSEILEWVRNGGSPWYHRSGPWMKPKALTGTPESNDPIDGAGQPKHIQHLVVQSIPEINEALQNNFSFVHGFNSGLIGYDRGTVEYSELKTLLSHLYGMFGDRIFRWGSEQTMHGLILCGKGATPLPMDDYMVFTDFSRDKAVRAKFVHFIGEFRFNGLIYPKLAAQVIRELGN